MGNRTPPTFNTVKHSNRDKRVKKQQQRRALILGMMVVCVLLIVALLVFAVCSIVAAVTRDNTPAGTIQYQDATKFSTDIESGTLIVINQNYSIDNISTSAFVTLTASDIPTVDGNPIYKIAKSLQLHTDAQTAFNAMMTEYYKIYGNEDMVQIKEAYRTLEEQAGYSTPAGKSDHHSGYLLRLGTADGADLTTAHDHWIQKNCYKYGFVIRYPNDKQAQTGITYDYSECIRYVGVAHATYMKEHNLCLEEYVQQLQGYTKDTQLQINGADGKLYSVYYVPATAGQLTQLQVPSNYTYEVSGDNIGGFIVTVNLSDPRA